MKLYTSKFSPYGRKVRLWAYVIGCHDRLEIVDLSATGTFVRPINYEKINPLGKVPALQINNEMAIIDSPLICDFLSKTFAPHKEVQFQDLQLEAIADGLCDAAVLRRGESQRPPELRSEAFDTAQKDKVMASLRFFEERAMQLRTYQVGKPVIYSRGEVALMAALGYLNFRFSSEPWQTQNPSLAKWFSSAAAWEPFNLTQP